MPYVTILSNVKYATLKTRLEKSVDFCCLIAVIREHGDCEQNVAEPHAVNSKRHGKQTAHKQSEVKAEQGSPVKPCFSERGFILVHKVVCELNNRLSNVV